MEVHVTEIIISIAPALPLGMARALWAMLEWSVPITDILEEVNLVLFCEQGSPNRMYRCVTPSLWNRIRELLYLRRIFELQYFVVKTALAFKELEVLHVGFTSPEIEIANFKITPD